MELHRIGWLSVAVSYWLMVGYQALDVPFNMVGHRTHVTRQAPHQSHHPSHVLHTPPSSHPPNLTMARPVAGYRVIMAAS